LPVQNGSLQVLKWLSRELDGRLPIIGVGGIIDGASAADKIEAGADLVQIYTGFIYEGPKLIAQANDAIAAQRGRG